jgi:hypothetical protein
MSEERPAPRSGMRDNGLRCSGYTAIGDVDPRVAGVLLDSLRDEGIAAYVTPTPASSGGYLEVRVPTRQTDRLFADTSRLVRARELLAAAEPRPEIDFDVAWKEVLGSLQAPESSPVPPWPVSEDLDVRTVAVPREQPIAAAAAAPQPEDHFVPPPPPPLPKLRRPTVLALAAIVAGIVILATRIDGGSLAWLGVVALLGGVGTLFWQVKDGPPTDSGWDDGAVV